MNKSVKVIILNPILAKYVALFLVEIDFHLGTRVFGFRDLKTGKFLPKANFSIGIDAFCDGVRYTSII